MQLTSAIALLIIYTFSSSSYSQNSITPRDADDGGEYYPEQNDAAHPCITPQQYEKIEARCAANVVLLGMAGERKNGITTSLSWPLQPANGLNDCSYYYISAHVDQNTASSAVQDYNCGTVTYDGHKGTDIAIYPFPFDKMDNDQMEVIAAAAGTITDKSDGNFDKNCSSNSSTANYMVIQHSDGSRALYFHMKKNSLTSKTIGQTVSTGEYLGVVGSSGNSSSPHLHFEIWSGSTSATLNDPFSGSCNTLNANSWWASQKSYKETGIIKVSVNTTDVVVPGCPSTETLNESDSFSIPFQGAGLPAGYAKFYIFLRQETTGLTADLKIMNPNGTTFTSWASSSTADYKASYRGWSKLLPVVPGTYTFQATYNGTTCSKSFTVGDLTGLATHVEANQPCIYPNPSNGNFMIDWEDSGVLDREIEVYNALGKSVFKSEIFMVESKVNADLPGGIYFYKMSENAKSVFTGNLIIQ